MNMRLDVKIFAALTILFGVSAAWAQLTPGAPTVNITWPGTAGLSNYGSAPTGTVPAVNAYVTNPISASITWPGSAVVANFGTAPTGTVPGVNAAIPAGVDISPLGITPVVSASAESSHVLKNAAGTAYAVYATNLTATAGFLVILNATSAPGDGAITPLACAPLPPNGVSSVSYAPGPPGVFSTGITAVVSSATTCFTKTTGTITAFISGSVK